MSTMFPASLVQIHYHNRCGGVRTVMASYSDCFQTIAGIDAPNIWVGNKEQHQDAIPWFVDLPEAAYHWFHSAATFERTVCKLAGKLRAILTSQLIRLPVAVIGHNLNLGKNPALTAAFNRCAEELSDASGNYRFFSMMHDFVEDGRILQMERMRSLERQGIDIFGMLHSHRAPVHIIVPNTEAAVHSTLPRAAVTVLPNRTSSPVYAPVDLPDRSVIYEQLERHASAGKMVFDPAKPLFCYPSRIIYRKNFLEALLLSTIIAEGTLVTGMAGTSRSDRHLVTTMHSLSHRYRLSLVEYVPHLSAGLLHERRINGASPFAFLYPVVAAVLSTSRSEGFGYSFTEPFLYDVHVVGRRPAGTSFVPGMNLPWLYKRLPIPVSWISINDWYSWFAGIYAKIWEKNYLSLQQFTKLFVLEETVDFGMLEELQQINIIKQLCACENKRIKLDELLSHSSKGWPGWDVAWNGDKRVNGCNKEAVCRWQQEEFSAAFRACFIRSPDRLPDHRWFEAITAFYRQHDHFLPNERK